VLAILQETLLLNTLLLLSVAAAPTANGAELIAQVASTSAADHSLTQQHLHKKLHFPSNLMLQQVQNTT
jgi:hypothetical protein